MGDNLTTSKDIVDDSRRERATQKVATIEYT